MSDQKIDVDALIERLRAAWRSGTEREAADALSTLKAERDAAVADRDKPYVSRSLAIIKELDALRADLERAREALTKIHDDARLDLTDMREIARGFLSSPAPVETPPTVGTIVMSPTDFEKFKRAIDPSPEPYEPRKRPKGSNADEWQLFLVEHANASAFLAVQIAEAIDDASKGARA